MNRSLLFKLAAFMASIAFIVMPELALAQSMGFDEAGNRGLQALCGFIKSPMVTLIAGGSILAALITVILNEDNRMLGTILKIVIGVMCVIFLGSILSMIGLPGLNC